MAPNTLAPAKLPPMPISSAPGLDLPLASDHDPLDDQAKHVAGNPLPPTTPGATPNIRASAEPSCDGLDSRETQRASAVATLSPGQSTGDAHSAGAGASTSGPDHAYDDAHLHVVRAEDSLLLVLADAVDDLERVRIATENRLRSLDQVKGMADTREAARMRDIADALLALEHQATLDLNRAMRSHPLGSWVKRTIGIGEKQAARLLAAIGDPAERPNPAKLWQYCGHGDPARSHCRKGRPVEHSPTAKMRVHLIAKSCIRQAHSPYRAVYDRERLKWAERDTSDGHKHNHALRVVGKEVLKDLWREARNPA